jgi:hypothetical protein
MAQWWPSSQLEDWLDLSMAPTFGWSLQMVQVLGGGSSVRASNGRSLGSELWEFRRTETRNNLGLKCSDPVEPELEAELGLVLGISLRVTVRE